MIASALLFAFASATALFILACKLNIRRVLGYDAMVDVIMTVILMSSFSGTVTGMAAAMFAGCIMSIMLLVARKLYGYERLVKVGTFRLAWKYYPPKSHIIHHED